MRTWMETLASEGFRLSKTFATLATLLLVTAASAFAQPAAEETGGEAALKLPDLSSVSFLLGMDGHRMLLIGLLFCVFGLGFGMVILHAPEEPAGASLHARDLGADLRNLQDLPDHAGQVHADSVGIHRGHHRSLLRRAAPVSEADCATCR